MPTPRPFEPDDILRLQAVGDPQIAPDGSQVVYTVTTLDAEQDKASRRSGSPARARTRSLGN